MKKTTKDDFAISIIPRFVLTVLLLLAIVPELPCKGIVAWNGNWDTWEKATSTLENLITITALIIGSIWTYYTFIKGRALTPHMEPRVSGRVSHNGQAKYLFVLIQIKNTGAAKINIVQEGTGVRVYSLIQKKASSSVEWKDVFEGQEKIFVLKDHYWIEPSEVIEEPLLIQVSETERSFYKIRLRVNSHNRTWETAAIIEDQMPNGANGTGKRCSN
jgi:hypothetical protein